MGVSRIGTVTATPAASATWSISPPSGTDTAGDIIVAVLSPTVNNTHLIDQDQDWTWLTVSGRNTTSYSTGRMRQIGIWRSDGSAPASFGFTLSGSSGGYVVMARYRSDSGSVLVQTGDAHPGSDANTASWSFAGYDAELGGLVVGALSSYSNTGTATTLSPSSGWSQIARLGSVNADNAILYELDEEIESLATIPTLTVTPSIAHDLDEYAYTAIVLSDSSLGDGQEIIAHRNRGTTVSTFATTINVTLPLDIRVGDKLIAYVSPRDGTKTISTPSGWTQELLINADNTDTTTAVLYIFSKDIIEAGDIPGGAVAFTVSGTAFVFGTMIAIRGGAEATMILGSSYSTGASTTSSHTLPAVESTIEEALRYWVIVAYDATSGYPANLVDKNSSFYLLRASGSAHGLTHGVSRHRDAGEIGAIALTPQIANQAVGVQYLLEPAEAPPWVGSGSSGSRKLRNRKLLWFYRQMARRRALNARRR